MTAYVFARNVAKSEWSALPRDFTKGEVVQRGSDSYGLCRDDAMYGKTETVPCVAKENPDFFFTVPVSMLNNENGTRVSGDYWVP